MYEGWLAAIVMSIALVAFGIGASVGADVIRRNCINGDTVRFDGTLYRANCVPIAREVER